MKSIKLILVLAFVSAMNVFGQTAEADKILGVWVTADGNARVKIEKIGNKYFGKTIWMKEPNDPETGKPKVDKMNPDESLRNQPRIGLRIMKDFTYEGKGVYKDGNIYDPNKGKTYCGKLTLVDDDNLDMRGNYCGFGLLGKTSHWTRYKE